MPAVHNLSRRCQDKRRKLSTFSILDCKRNLLFDIDDLEPCGFSTHEVWYCQARHMERLNPAPMPWILLLSSSRIAKVDQAFHRRAPDSRVPSRSLIAIATFQQTVHALTAACLGSAYHVIYRSGEFRYIGYTDREGFSHDIYPKLDITRCKVRNHNYRIPIV